MKSLCSLARTAASLEKFFRKLSRRSFTVSLQHNRYQLPKRISNSTEMAATTLKGQALDRSVLDSMLRRRMFYTVSQISIYRSCFFLCDLRSSELFQEPKETSFTVCGNLAPRQLPDSLVPYCNIAFCHTYSLGSLLSRSMVGSAVSMTTAHLVVPCKQMSLTCGADILFWRRICWKLTVQL